MDAGLAHLWSSQPGLPCGVATEEPDWPAMLRAVDEPVPPPLEATSESVPGQGDGIEVPRDFDYAAAKGRFGRLVERLGETFGCPLDYGHPQDSACFGGITIPAEATRTRAKRTREPSALEVLVSTFGGLATYRPLNDYGNQVVPVHPDDRQRIEDALDGLGYVIVPKAVLDTLYDGPNGWIFGPSPYGKADATWFIRFFDYL
jgi:hypothetical protein